MTQTFVDTIVVCTLTGLVLVTSGVVAGGADGATLAQQAYSSALPGSLGAWFVAASLACFAFSTILGWAYYGERNIQYLVGPRVVTPYRLAFVVMIVVASVARLDVVWTASEVLNGLMAFPNLIGLVLLSGIVVRETRSYFGRSGAQPSKRR